MDKGVYLLFIRLEERAELEIGSLGQFVFEPGLYCYVGSGLNGLDARVRRHKKEKKSKHWHIDYFLENSEISAVLKIRTEKDLECQLSGTVSLFAEDIPARGFGSSDCSCTSHLYFLGSGSM